MRRARPPCPPAIVVAIHAAANSPQEATSRRYTAPARDGRVLLAVSASRAWARRANHLHTADNITQQPPSSCVPVSSSPSLPCLPRLSCPDPRTHAEGGGGRGDMWTAHTAPPGLRERARNACDSAPRQAMRERDAREVLQTPDVPRNAQPPRDRRPDRQVESTVRSTPILLLCPLLWPHAGAHVPSWGLPTSSRLQARREIKLARKRLDVEEGSTPQPYCLHRKSLCHGHLTIIAALSRSPSFPRRGTFARRIASTTSTSLRL